MLPRPFNEGGDAPPEWLELAVLEVGDHLGAVRYETQIIEGGWQQAGVAYRDNRARIVVLRTGQWLASAPTVLLVGMYAAAAISLSWMSFRHPVFRKPRVGRS